MRRSPKRVLTTHRHTIRIPGVIDTCTNSIEHLEAWAKGASLAQGAALASGPLFQMTAAAVP